MPTGTPNDTINGPMNDDPAATTGDQPGAVEAVTPPRPAWQGINHLALVTADMDATTRFWHEVLGADLVATIDTDAFKHYFFRVGDAQTIAFFEYLDTELDDYAKPAGVPYRAASQFDHLALGVADEAALIALRERLLAYDCEVTDIVDHGFIRSIYFSDPTGIALEASYWATDLDRPMTAAPERFLDADPVPAARELIATGTIAKTPRTELVDEIRTGVSASRT